jgi:GT2 family glycosyltransferase
MNTTRSAPKVSIILLNWNSYDVTEDCLLSLRELNYQNVEVVLVDNGSTDGSVEEISRNFPELRLIKNDKNLGFTGGNNVGIRDVLDRGTDYILLLNNDTVVAPDFLAELVRVAESDAKIGMLNPKIYFFEPRDRIWYAGAIHKCWWSFPKIIGLHKRDNGNYDQIREVSFVTGCALLIKAGVVRQIGLLDEMFFFGFEDVDWSVRAIQAGFKAVFVPSSVIWHKDSYVTRNNTGKQFRDYYSMRNCILFARKHLATRYWPLFVFSLGRYLVYHTAGYLVRVQFKRVAALYKGIWNGCCAKMPDKSACV